MMEVENLDVLVTAEMLLILRLAIGTEELSKAVDVCTMN